MKGSLLILAAGVAATAYVAKKIKDSIDEVEEFRNEPLNVCLGCTAKPWCKITNGKYPADGSTCFGTIEEMCKNCAGDPTDTKSETTTASPESVVDILTTLEGIVETLEGNCKETCEKAIESLKKALTEAKDNAGEQELVKNVVSKVKAYADKFGLKIADIEKGVSDFIRKSDEPCNGNCCNCNGTCACPEEDAEACTECSEDTVEKDRKFTDNIQNLTKPVADSAVSESASDESKTDSEDDEVMTDE